MKNNKRKIFRPQVEIFDAFKKPLEVILKNWIIVEGEYITDTTREYHLFGNVFNHLIYSDDYEIITTPVVMLRNFDGYKLIETQNTIYRLNDADINPKYKGIYPKPLPFNDLHTMKLRC